MIIYEKEYLQQLHSSVGEAIFAVKIPERTIEYVNPAIKKVFGYSSRECIGKPTEIIYQSRQDFLNFGKLVTKAIQRNKRILNMEFELKRKNGEVFPAEITTSFIKNNNKILSAVSIVKDITQRKQAEERLNKYHNHLEELVVSRTSELKQKTVNLEETNIALKVLLEQRKADKKEIEKNMLNKIEKLVFPYLDKLKEKKRDHEEYVYITIIESNLKETTSHISPDLFGQFSKLTKTEIQIADMIRMGKATKEIAELLKLSPTTIATHRQNIRKKLALTNKKMNLRTALSTNK